MGPRRLPNLRCLALGRICAASPAVSAVASSAVSRDVLDRAPGATIRLPKRDRAPSKTLKSIPSVLIES